MAFTTIEDKKYQKSYFFEDYKKQYGKTYEEDFESIKAQGIWNTVPMLTLMARRYSGSEQDLVRRTASMPRAAAERKIAPTLVGFIIFSRNAMRLEFLRISSGL